jgi:hypothetical protein
MSAECQTDSSLPQSTLGQVLPNFGQELTRAEGFRNVIIAAGRPRLLLFPAERIGRDCSTGGSESNRLDAGGENVPSAARHGQTWRFVRYVLLGEHALTDPFVRDLPIAARRFQNQVPRLFDTTGGIAQHRP